MAEIDNLSISIGASAAAAIAELDKLATSLKRFSGASRKVKSSASEVDKGMQDVASSAQKAETHTSSFADKLGKLQSALSKTAPKFKELASAAATIGRVSFSPVTSALGSMGNAAKSAYSSVTGLFSQIGRVAFYRLIRTGIKLVTQALSEGIKTLYHYSETFSGTFYQSMNAIATSANYVKNSIAAMVSPLITAVTPVLTSIADKIVDVFNLINQFIARLTGQSTYTAAKKVSTLWDDATKKTAASTQKANSSASKSTKDTAKGISDTVKKTADEIKRYTLGFDELNILGKNKDNGGADSGAGGGSSGGLGDIALPTSSGASSSGTDYGSLFETRKIDGAVSDFADAIRKAFENQDWQGLGSLIGNKINSALDSVNWSGIGKKVGTALNGVIETAYYLLDTINFTNIGKHIAEFLNNAIEQINFNTLGRLMVKKMTIIPDMIIGFLVEFDWGQAAAKLSDFAIGCFEEITKWFRSHDWEELGGILFQKIDDAVSNVKFADIAKAIFKAIGAALRATSLFTIGFYEGIAGKIKAWFVKDIMNHKWTDIASSILSAIGKGFSNIGSWVYDNIIDPFMSELLGEDWDKLKPVAKNIFDAINENWIANNFAVELAVKAKNEAKKWWSDVQKWWNDEGRDKWEFFQLKVKDDASKWWKDVQTFWANLGDRFVEISAKVRDDASKWWSDVRGFWKERRDDVLEIAATVKNDATQWWSNVQNWWAEKVGNVKEFATTVTNNSTIWWALVQGWWIEKVGYVQDFLVNVKNTSSVWWNDVKAYWTNFMTSWRTLPVTASIVNNISSLWGNVVSWWNQQARNLWATLNIRLPRVEITWRLWEAWKGGPGCYYPDFSVKWNALGGILDSPTLFGMLGNNLLGGGEAGREAVLPLETHTEWMNTVAERVWEGMPRDNVDLSDSIRQGMDEAVASQNELLREQNQILRMLLAKEFVTEISTADINRAQARSNRRAGTTIVPMTT